MYCMKHIFYLKVNKQDSLSVTRHQSTNLSRKSYQLWVNRHKLTSSPPKVVWFFNQHLTELYSLNTTFYKMVASPFFSKLTLPRVMDSWRQVLDALISTEEVLTSIKLLKTQTAWAKWIFSLLLQVLLRHSHSTTKQRLQQAQWSGLFYNRICSGVYIHDPQTQHRWHPVLQFQALNSSECRSQTSRQNPSH